MSDPRHQWKQPEVDRLAVGKLVEELYLRASQRQRLAEDTALIADWYLQPALQARVGLGQERLLEELTRAGKLALKLRDRDPAGSDRRVAAGRGMHRNHGYRR